jgi:hypothetical protein
MIYDKSNISYDKCENSLMHDKTGLLAVQLFRKKSYESRFLGATEHSFFLKEFVGFSP